MLFRLFALASLATTALAGDFSTPPSNGDDNLSKNPIYQIGTTIDVQWESDLDWISLILWQNSNNALETVAGNISNTGSYKWKVATTKAYQSQTFNNGEVFFLQIFEPGQTAPAFTSHFFNITAPSVTTTTSATTSSATPSSTATGSTTSSTATATANAVNNVVFSTSTSSSSSSSSSNSVALGAGLGVGLGVPLLAAIAALVWFLRRRKSRQEVAVVPQSQMANSGPGAGAMYKAAPADEAAAAGGAAGYYQPQEKAPFLGQQSGPAEMMDSGSQPRYEMDGSTMAVTGGEGRLMHEMPGTQH